MTTNAKSAPGKKKAAAKAILPVVSVAQIERQPAPRPDAAELHRLVAETAYRLWQERGCREGHDRDDWAEAERIILERLR